MKLKSAFSTLLAYLLVCGCGFLATATEPTAELPFLHPLFSDHVVLQRGIRVPVWGWAKPGTKVVVAFGGQVKTAMAQVDGRWMVHLSPMPVSVEPRTLKVTSAEAGQSVAVQDVLVGDVWLCSGQSNMEMGIGACNATNDIASANFPHIRLLTVPRQISNAPVASLQCQWLPCSPETILHGQWAGFSAAAFYFGRELYQQLDVPIGLIHSSWGGTVAEAWTSAEGLQPLGDFEQKLEQVAAAARGQTQDYDVQYEQWCRKNDPGTQQGWERPDLGTAGWKTVPMPKPIEAVGLADFDGIIWFRRSFEVPQNWLGQPVNLGLGPVDDIDTTFINGIKVGQMNRYDLNRVYAVPTGVLKPGANVVSVRVLDTGGFGGFTGTADQMFLRPTTDANHSGLSLAGEWQMRDSAPLSRLPAPPAVQDGNNPNTVTVLYNGMIAPLLPFAIKGAIWYQGESNAERAYQYRRLLPAMIRDWRRRFGLGEFPFYIVQLAAWQATQPAPRDNEWAELREAQALTARTVPHCGLAVAIDIGEANDIHPKNKAEVGRRLALWALAQTYGKKIEFSGPWYRKMKIKRNSIRVSFDHVDGGLIAKGGTVKGFAIAGEDRKFVWADATIEGKQVVVSAPGVDHPVAVRYAWDIDPVCNLYNQAGLPAVPFRTDDWPGITSQRK